MLIWRSRSAQTSAVEVVQKERAFLQNEGRDERSRARQDGGAEGVPIFCPPEYPRVLHLLCALSLKKEYGGVRSERQEEEEEEKTRRKFASSALRLPCKILTADECQGAAAERGHEVVLKANRPKSSQGRRSGAQRLRFARSLVRSLPSQGSLLLSGRTALDSILRINSSSCNTSLPKTNKHIHDPSPEPYTRTAATPVTVSDSFPKLFVSDPSSQTAFSVPHAAVPTVTRSHSSFEGCSTGKTLLRTMKRSEEHTSELQSQ